MTAYSLLVAVHAAAGAVALLCYWAAAALRKGSARHRRVGQVYLLAMSLIVLTGLPMAYAAYADGKTVQAAFLGYLVVIVAAGNWSAWRSIRDRHDIVRYTGPVYVALGALAGLSALGVLALGASVGSPLLMGFSVVGLAIASLNLRTRLSRARLATQPRWWLTSHYTAMIGNGIGTHIAFLAIGLPRLWPALGGPSWQYVAWFGPVVVAVLVKRWIDRRYAPPPRTAATRAKAGTFAHQARPA